MIKERSIDNDSSVGYDSELDESAFDEVHKVFEYFIVHFQTHCIHQERAKLTMMYQVLRNYGLPLMEGIFLRNIVSSLLTKE